MVWLEIGLKKWIIKIMKTEERTNFLDRDQLRLYFEQGCKPHSEWGIGSEYENFIFDTDLKRPVAYEGPKSISKVFDVLIKKFGWAPLFAVSYTHLTLPTIE